ncbi:hypothetical protein PBY51_005580 [Eleginops maclovinus]|uniref:Uncharacterized protein n=1 Tax=Eleginops maclovinus TaxID=56733 RepID=A0AAN7X5U1_ELEMC|nr:hypothetical protein PBY51_005580 [Eleginops maclovinus]
MLALAPLSVWYRYEDKHMPCYPDSPHHSEPHRRGQKSEDEGSYSSSPSVSMNNSDPSRPENIFQLSLKHENTARLHAGCQQLHKLLKPTQIHCDYTMITRGHTNGADVAGSERTGRSC